MCFSVISVISTSAFCNADRPDSLGSIDELSHLTTCNSFRLPLSALPLTTIFKDQTTDGKFYHQVLVYASYLILSYNKFGVPVPDSLAKPGPAAAAKITLGWTNVANGD